MTEIVRIHGKLMHSDAVGGVKRPWADAPIEVTYHGYSQTPTEQRPTDRTPIRTNPDGTWEVFKWVNALGDFQSYYSFKFPFDRPIKVYLPSGTPPEIEFSQLAIASTPPSDPSYPSLIALINDLFAAGDFTASANLVPLNPALPGLGGTVQTAIAAQQTAIAANHTAILALQGQPPPELKSLPDLSMVGATDGAIITYRAASQDFELRNDLQNILIDGGNF
jgi:hypothetical protein